jgi:hypothetical protein
VKRLARLLVLVGAVGASHAQGKDAKVTGDPRPVSGVNWAGQVIRATGAGAPDLKAASPAQARLGAERAALADALRNLLAQVKGVAVDGTRKLGEMMEKDEVRLKVEGLVRGYKVVGKRYYSDGGVELDVEVPVALLTDVVDPDPTQVPLVQALPPSPPPMPALEPGPKRDPEVASTGLVIDARGLKVMPALAPRVLDDAGKALYTVDSLSAEARKTTGVASYVQSLEEARKSLKAGDQPMVVKAAKASGADLHLASDDARKLAATTGTFLSQGKVVIVLN